MLKYRNDLLAESQRCLHEAENALVWEVTKGSDNNPAKSAEINNLQDLIAHNGNVGPIVIGDHRLNVRCITEGAFVWLELARQYGLLAEKAIY